MSTTTFVFCKLYPSYSCSINKYHWFSSDRKIADHVVKVHQYRDPREADGDVTVISSSASELATHKAQQVKLIA